MHIVNTAANASRSWLLNHSTSYMRVATRRSQLRNEVGCHWLSLAVFEITSLLTWIQRSSSRCIFVRRILDLVALIARCFFKAFSLLVVYLTVSVSRHHRALLTEVRVLHFVAALCHLNVGCRTLRFNASCWHIWTQTEKLEMLLSILNWWFFLVPLAMFEWCIVAALMHGVLVWMHCVFGWLIWSISSEEVAGLRVNRITDLVPTSWVLLRMAVRNCLWVHAAHIGIWNSWLLVRHVWLRWQVRQIIDFPKLFRDFLWIHIKYIII